MIDSEDIINSITSYLTEVVGSKSRINNAVDVVNSEKGDNMLPNVSNTIILGQRIQEVNTFVNGRMNIDIIGDTKFNPEYDTVAKNYIAEISYIIADTNATNTKTFLKALRMERVITDVMKNYFKDNQEAGLIHGEIESSFTPERVLLGNTATKAIKSGVVYNFVLF